MKKAIMPLAAAMFCTVGVPAEARQLLYEKTVNTTSWSQKMPFNSFLPQYSANRTDSVREDEKCGKVEAGCAATAYVQYAAYHQWPVLIDDTFDSHLATLDTAFYPAVFHLSSAAKIDWSKIYDKYTYRTCTESERYAAGLLQLWVDIHASMRFSASGSTSTTGLPMYNEWYEGMNYYPNSASKNSDYREKRAAMVRAMKESLEAGVPLMAGINSRLGAHVVLVDGVREYDEGWAEFHVNYGWSGSSDGWYSMGLEVESYNSSLSGVYSLHFPRKKAQVEQLPLESGTSAALTWHFPKYWADKVSGFTVNSYTESANTTTFTDNFTSVVDDKCRLQPNSSYPEAFKVEEGALKVFNACDRQVKYTWPEVLVPTAGSVFSADVKSYFTGGNIATIEIKVGNGEWLPIYTWENFNGDGQWKKFTKSLAEYAGKPCRFRVQVIRSSYASRTNAYGYQLKNLSISGVKKMVESKSYSVAASARSYTVSSLASGKVHSFTVTPQFRDAKLVGEASKPVATRANVSTPAVPQIVSVKRGEVLITDNTFFKCPYNDGAEFTVTCSGSVSSLEAHSGYRSLFEDKDITVENLGGNQFKVRLTPPATMTAAGVQSMTDGQRMILTLEAVASNGNRVMKDISLAFASSLDQKKEDPNAKYVMVHWNTNGGEPIASWKVKTDTHIVPPTPTRQDYRFLYWDYYGEYSFTDNVVGQNNGAYGDESYTAVWKYEPGYKDVPSNPEGYGEEEASEPNPDEDWNSYEKHYALSTMKLSSEEKTLLVNRLGSVNGSTRSIRTPNIRLNGKKLSDEDAFNAALLFDQYEDNAQELKFEISAFDPATGNFKFNLNKNLVRGSVVLYGCDTLNGEWTKVKTLSTAESNATARKLAADDSHLKNYKFYKLALER